MSKKGFALKVLAGFGFVIAIAQPSWAQIPSGSADLLKDPQSQDPINSLFNDRGDASPTSIMDLMQRLTQNSLSPDEFRQQQNEYLNNATAEFFAKQRKLLQTAPNAQPTTPTPAPQKP